MNQRFLVYASLLIILVFIGFMIYDSVSPQKTVSDRSPKVNSDLPEDMWEISASLQISDGTLRAVTAGNNGSVFLGGDRFISCYTGDLKTEQWRIQTDAPVSALFSHGDTVYASTLDQILVISVAGKKLNEWGPYDANSIITSVAANSNYVAYADAGNRKVYLLDRGGEVMRIIAGDPGFVLPSAYFDVMVKDDNSLIVANPGHRRIEMRSADGKLQSYFGEPGLSPEAFCGCCNPSHFTIIPDGFVTAEKGLNRIKILDNKGDFIEFVSSVNDFVPSIPLDLAFDGNDIYAANPANSTLYVFKRKVTR